jgi:transforming growth factor-beta-induced protein
MNRFSALPLLVAAGLLLGACAPQATPAPSTDVSAATEAAMPSEEPMAMSIVDIASGDGRFTTLVGALQSAGLVEALQGAGPFTVFAPNDEAFAKLPVGTLESLSPDQLKDILLYHVVGGKVMSADAAALDGQSIDTLLEGKQIMISASGGKVMVNDANVVSADIVASNGVIHVIDSVLLPPAN